MANQPNKLMSQQEIQVVSEQHPTNPPEAQHPTPRTYFMVALALSVITAIEVGIFYITGLGYGIIPILAILSAAKFALVVMFYMHLRYDNKIYSGLFFSGMCLAIAVVFALIALFQFFA